MTKVEVGGVASALVVAAITVIVGFAGTGFFTGQSAELNKRVLKVEVDQAKQSGMFDEILRRLDRIETKLDQERK